MAPHSSTLAWEIHGRRSPVGYSPWGRTESDTTEATQQQQQQPWKPFSWISSSGTWMDSPIPTPISLGAGLSRVASGLSQDLLCPASVLGRRELAEAPDLGPPREPGLEVNR